MKSHEELLLQIRSAIDEHFSQEPIEVDPIPEPIPEPIPDGVYTIEIDERFSIPSGRTFPAGTKINYIVHVKKDGKDASGVPVIFDFPDGDIRVVSDKGHTPVHGYSLPTGGIDMEVYLENHPHVNLRWVTNAIGMAPTPEAPKPIPEAPKPTIPTPPTPTQKEYSTPPDGNGTQVLVMAMDSPNIDVRLNGKWYKLNDFDSDMEGKNYNGKIFRLPDRLYALEFDPNQIRVNGLNLWDFGAFNFKILCRHPDSNLHAPTWATSGGIHFWGTSHCGGRIVSAGGYNNVVEPNPEFWKFSVPDHYNGSGKIAIFLNAHGRPHESFDPFGDLEW